MEQYSEYLKNFIIEKIKSTNDLKFLQIIYEVLKDLSSEQEHSQKQ